MKITTALVLEKLREMYSLSYTRRSFIGIDSLALALNTEINAIKAILEELQAAGKVQIDLPENKRRMHAIFSSGRVSLV